ncbi:MAG: tetratricopeptide repeat protein [Gemmataceae bacterium]|nr:tetratricopeptide repeat protein [Gemmataceae bacterium]
MRTCSLLLCFALVALLPGCSREGPAPVEPPAPKRPTLVAAAQAPLPGVIVGGAPQAEQAPAPAFQPVNFGPDPLEADKQEKYETALQDAFNLLAQRKYPDALAALEAARTFKDTPFLRGEIDKLKLRVDQQAAAERIVQDIQTILDQGKTAEAAQLAGSALLQYGATDVAPQLTRLKLQADALIGASINDNPAKHRRFREEGEAALRDRNLRGAVVAFEQALQAGEDAALRKRCDEVRAAVAFYDEKRAKAAELRRDPATLEDALAFLQEAAKAWDTLQLRQEIDEYTVALQKRRERVGVADFEVRGEVGIPAAGRTLADELLPHLKLRYDLVERGQLAKVVDELKLTAGRLADSEGDRREVGRLAKLRYLVVGSITPLGGLTAHARLVDVRTGLVVQTAKVVAPGPEQLVALMPELGKLLLMSDGERLAYERQQAQVARLAPPPPLDAPLPPPPEVLAQGQPLPPPVVIDTRLPVALGGVVLQDFQRLPPPPPQGQPVKVVEVVQVVEPPVKRRLLHLSLEVGDNLFRRGHYREAQRHFEFALNLSPGNVDLQVRLERTRPYLPPPPPVVVVEAPPPPRPRVAVLDFAVLADPRAVPPGLGSWTPEHLAPYFCPTLRVVDRGEVAWYLGRSGVTLRDLMVDPHARRWLGRALNVRYFLLGNINQADGAGSLEVSAHLLDAEYGFVQGAGRILVHDPAELKLRLGELARLTLMNPAERQRYEEQSRPVETLLVEARKSSDRGELTVALGLFQKAAGLRPGSIEIQVLLQKTNRRAELAALEEARRREFERVQAEIRAQQQRQLELARLAEEARIRAAERAAALAADQRRLEEERRLREQQAAQSQLVLQARVAFKKGEFRLAIQMFEGAAGLRPNDDVHRELALARAEAERGSRARAAEEAARREAELRRVREEELKVARLRLEEERRRRLAEEDARRKAQEERDHAAYQQLFDEGQRLLNRGQYDGAIASLQSARRLRKTDAVEALLNRAMADQAAALARAKGESERLALERRLAEERERRIKAEAEAKRNQALYQQALELAQKAMAAQNYDLAHAKYEEAARVFRTDVVLTGLREAETRRTEARARAERERTKQQQEQAKAANLRRLLAEGQAALATGKHDQAVKSFAEAKGLAPDNVDILVGLSKAEQARDRARAEARSRDQEKERLGAFRKLLDAGQANLANKQYDAAVLTLDEAMKLKPGDPTALQARAQADKARQQAKSDARTSAEAKRKADAYQKAMGEGRAALSSRQFDSAIKAFGEAQTLLPGDQSSATFLKEAQKAKTDSAAALAAEAKKRADDAQRTANLQKALTAGRAALAAGNLQGAASAFDSAAKLAPGDPGVVAARAGLQKAQQARETQEAARRQRQQQQQALLATGRTALAAKRYDEAEKAFAQAATLVPEDRTAQDLLGQTRKARADAQTAADAALKQKQADAQRAEQLRKHLDAGRVALKAGRLDDAARSFAEASKLAPQDPAVTAAQRELDQARAAAANADRAKKQAAYQAAIDSGQKALAAKRYDDAIKSFTEAGRLVPGDATATRLLADAQKGQNDTRAAAAQAQQTVQKVQQFVAAGRKALAAKQLEEAARQFAEAAKLAPQDPTVQAAQRDLNQARVAEQAARTAQEREAKARAEEQQRQAEFNRLMGQGQAAMAAKRYADAIKSYQEALKIRPNEPTATRLLREATQAQEAATRPAPAPQPKPAPPPPPPQTKPTPPPTPQVKPTPPAPQPKPAPPAPAPQPKPAPAPAAQTKPAPPAPQPKPTPPPAAQPRPAPPPPPQPSPQARAEYSKKMQAAATFEKQQKLPEAVRAFEDALKQIPQDPRASEGLRRTKYALHMSQGQAHLNARRFPEAVRAFEAALQVRPNDAAATESLRRAKAGR